MPLEDRRKKLEQFAKKSLKSNPIIRLSPITNDMSVARKWFRMGVALDGVIAKLRDLPYQSGERTGMQKIKRQRTAECVVGGFRYLAKEPLVGSLLLGLYNDEGKLDHFEKIGVTEVVMRLPSAPRDVVLPTSSLPRATETGVRRGAANGSRLPRS